MLHILGLILKVILIILGILLGLLLLVVLLVLFCPVRYKVSAVKAGGDWKQAEGEGSVSWLFRGISLKVKWKEQKLETSFHLFGIPVDKLLKKRQNKKNDSDRKAKAEKSKPVATLSKPQKNKTAGDLKDLETDSGKNQSSINTDEESVKQNQRKNKASENDGSMSDARIDMNWDGQKPDAQDTGTENLQTEKTVSEGGSKDKQFFIKKIYEKIKNICRGIRTKLQNLRKTFKKIRSNLSWWKAFLEHPRVIAARNLVWKHAKFLLRHVFPTKIEGQVIFSFEDPALTGTALAVLGMTIPFHKNRVQINPRFDGEKYLQGDIRAKGRIYGFVFVRAALIIYFDKNIKYVIKRWKTRRA